MKFQCQYCSNKTEFYTCDDCLRATLRGLLKDENWRRWRGVAKGDLEGETLEGTIRRELHALEAKEIGS